MSCRGFQNNRTRFSAAGGEDSLELLHLLLVLRSQLFHLSVMFQHELGSDPVHHVVSVLLMDPFGPS